MSEEDDKAQEAARNEINSLTVLIAEYIAGMGVASSPRLCFVLMSLAEANCKAIGLEAEEVLADVLAAEFDRRSVQAASIN